jgi:hypothetical protein
MCIGLQLRRRSRALRKRSRERRIEEAMIMVVDPSEMHDMARTY